MAPFRLDLGAPRWDYLLLAVVIGVFLAVATRFADQPFVWRYDYPSAHNSTNAINHLNYGLAVTKGSLVRNANPSVPERLIFSSHHPPFLSLVVAASYAVFGVHPAAARGVVILFSTINVLLLYWAVRMLIGRATALAAASVFTLLPLQIVYSTKVNFEPLVLTFVLGMLVAYAYWLRRPSTARFAAMAAIFCVGTTVDWSAYYIGGILPAFHFALLWYRRQPIARTDYLLWLLPLLGVLMFALFLAQLYWVDPNLLHGLTNLAKERGGVQTGHDYSEVGFSNLSLVQRAASRSAVLFTLPVLALGVTGLLLALARLVGLDRGKQQDEAYLVLLWVVGMAHFVVFRHVSWVHEFLVYHFMAPVAVTAGWLIAQAVRILPGRVAGAAVLIFALCFLPLSLLQARQAFWDGQIAGILELGHFLNENVPEGAVIFTTATHHPFLHPGVPHYAERDVVDGVESMEALAAASAGWKKSPRYLMAYGAPSANLQTTARFTQELASRYAGVKAPWGTLYDLSKPLGSPGAAPGGN
jgi:4-amino-4-deoxy-L-arabinose transferase-like glycosyltransferase